MGIPSYYRKLCSVIKGLSIRHLQSAANAVDWFFMDFNCLVYHCLRRPEMPVYTASMTQIEQDEWEQQLIDCVTVYCRKVIQHVAPTKGVYIAIDGVVPMAKMRQQRLRRFKSVWLKKHGSSESGGWDTNAITPGTVFMKKLRMGLEGMIRQYSPISNAKTPLWKLSSSDEPGEGEHKIMAQWRTGQYPGNVAIYGLDADLIVLSMLGLICQAQRKVWLFREEVEKGQMVYDATGNEVFEWFSIHLLRDWLTASFPSEVQQRQFILDYCFAMSVLGNDFLPSSLGYKMREDGHDALLRILQQLSVQGVTLIQPDLEINQEGLTALFRSLATHESDRILSYILKKQQQARHAIETGLGENNWPLGHIEENQFMHDTLPKQLHPSWRIKYVKWLGLPFSDTSVQQLCAEYQQGVRWIWAYYIGRPVCYNWFYPYALPPLWEYLAHATPCINSMIVRVQAEDIRPVEQLALVLPLESWSLIPSQSVEQRLPKIASQFYPTEFSFDSMGKRFFWECESMIPLPTILEVKALMAKDTIA